LPHKDPEKRKEYMRKYSKTHPDKRKERWKDPKVKKYMKNYRLKNKERNKQYQLDWYEKNKFKERINHKIKYFKKKTTKLIQQYKLFKQLKNDEIINGLLLSDAHLRNIRDGQNSELELEQSDKNESLVIKLQEHLTELGIATNTFRYLHKNTNTWGVKVYSYRSIAFTLLRKHWYDDRLKIVPNKIKITPKTLAYWFMGDGSSVWINKNKTKSMILLFTEGFTKNDTISLQKKLLDLGIKSHLQQKHKLEGRYFIVIGTSYDVFKFFEIVEPYILLSFRYKIKKPIRKTRAEAIRERFKKS